MSNKNKNKNKFFSSSVSDLLGASDAGSNGAEQISIDNLSAFKNHPFKVLYNDDMTDLSESIKENGVITPIIVRSLGLNQYEIISGHRRVQAAKMAGLTEVPAIVKELTDDEAIIAMVDANMQREEILPSERAWSLKMKYDAMKRQGKRADLTSAHFEPKLSSAELGESVGMSAAQVKRYIKLTDLIPELLNCLDEKTINASVGQDLAFIDAESQKAIYSYISKGNKLNGKQSKKLKDYNEDGKPIREGEVEGILRDNEDKKPKRTFKMSSTKIDQYFPEDVSEEKIEEIIIELLEKWKQGFRVTDVE